MRTKKVNLVKPGLHHLKLVKQAPLRNGGHQLVFISQDEHLKDTILLKLPRGHSRTQVFTEKLFGVVRDELSASDRLFLERTVITAQVAHSTNGLYADLLVETALVLKKEIQSEGQGQSKELPGGGQNARQVYLDLK